MVKKSASEWARWLRHGGGVWAHGELGAIAAGRHCEAYDYTFRLPNEEIPQVIRNAAKDRLIRNLKRDGYSEKAIKQTLKDYGLPLKSQTSIRRTSRRSGTSPNLTKQKITRDGKEFTLIGTDLKYGAERKKEEYQKKGYLVRVIQNYNLYYIYVHKKR